MHTINDKLDKVTARMSAAAQAAGRPPESVQLIAVSKTHPAEAIETAYHWGQRHFGENYLQEALDKRAALSHLDNLQWHFIGPIQSNKSRQIAENFDWVHTIDREKIARRLSDQRPDALPPLQVCLQVNIDDEHSKSGVALDELPALAQSVWSLPRLQLRGLMAIPAPSADPERQRAAFARLREALDLLNAGAPAALDTLSMGMSGDLEAAIAEGATLVRVGTDIFGPRMPKSTP
ncbi:YggS family pyridoxal phosphate-dependent enzyme [Marinimicrobium alkaliphilum]|uniref:YggS family pyridoxal phosphate-dependent enzyme n=1 Tax=Marinimicrobium alkaliphilum TaxID=2202654 RepID=UPI000DB95C4E|nr:YggS family pyridoxal phosphate-dependent enzyme [Marinimicrobium alkaliphilum]